jgi:hypothetical protein
MRIRQRGVGHNRVTQKYMCVAACSLQQQIMSSRCLPCPAVLARVWLWSPLHLSVFSTCNRQGTNSDFALFICYEARECRPTGLQIILRQGASGTRAIEVTTCSYLATSYIDELL